MDLYLIRHGETVDNVAGLYAGVRDSALTNYGVEQIARLGEYFAVHDVRFTHIFSSPLSRALKTAEAIQTAQPASAESSKDLPRQSSPEIIQVPDLIEQNFGSYEGTSFKGRLDAKNLIKGAHVENPQPSFVDAESKESVGARAERFLEAHLLPLFGQVPNGGRHVVAVVSHGVLLHALWKRLLLRLPRKTISSRDVIERPLEHLGGWSNTGYLELSFSQDANNGVAGDEVSPEPSTALPAEHASATQVEPATTATPSLPTPSTTATPVLEGWLTKICNIDSREHLLGLKRQRGGIGRSAHDEGQRKLDGFFKRQRADG